MKIKVIYIAGAGRSGSTLLSSMLGEYEGIINIGESRYLYSTHMRGRNIPCGCGKEIKECKFWGNFYEGILQNDIRFATRLVKAKNFPSLALRGKYFGFQGQNWMNLITSLHSMVHKVALESKSRVIVDASKHPTYGLILGQVPDIDFYVLHLIRDLRGVVGSWRKQKNYLKARPWISVTSEWNVYNLMSESLRGLGHSYKRMELEALTKNPRSFLSSVLDYIEEYPPYSPQMKSNQIMINLQHTLAGNPDKIKGKRNINIRPQPWDLPQGLRKGVTLLSWPSLVHYGYINLRRTQ